MTDKILHHIDLWSRTLRESSISEAVDGPAMAQSFLDDLQGLHQDIGFIFDDSYGSEARTDLTLRVLKKWCVDDRSVPSLSALCSFALQKLTDLSDEYIPVLVAAVLAEAPNNQPYHGTIHYKKVLLQLIRLIVAHNKIYADTPRFLTHDRIALLLIAACIHDLGHDGLGNVVKGVFESGRMERQAFEMARPSLKMAGLDGEALTQLEIMLLTTDVAPIGDPSSFTRQMKAAFCFHYRPEMVQTDALNLSEELKPLETNKTLAQMALLLHEADVATSAGLHYQLTKYETILYREELGHNDACPAHVIEFLEKTCQKKFFSDAGKRLYSANMARIYALAEHDVNEGNKPFVEKIEHSVHVLFDKDEDALFNVQAIH